MLIKKNIFFIFLTFIFFSSKVLSKEITYICKFHSSEPTQNSFDLTKIKLVLYIDYKNKTVRSEQGVDLFSIEFQSDKVSWFHEFVNPVNQEKRLSYDTFYINSKKFLSNIYPFKKNLSRSDLVAITEWNCR